MTRLRVVQPDDVPEHQCLLCGGPAHVEQGPDEDVVWDLCDPCAGVVQAVADRVAGQVVASLQAAADLIPAGQLTLGDDQ